MNFEEQKKINKKGALSQSEICFISFVPIEKIQCKFCFSDFP